MADLFANRLKVAGQSDVGLVRTLNEDNFLIDKEIGLLLVADGMGGHDAGEIASAQVIASITEFLWNKMEMDDLPSDRGEKTLTLMPDMVSSEDPTLDDVPNPIIATINAAVNHANSKVNGLNRKKGYPDGMGMGSTLVGMWLPPYSQQPIIFHVGDSRLYLYRKGRLVQITPDHTLYKQWEEMGGHGEPPARNILMRAMGPSRAVTPDIGLHEVERGDVVMLCSDGLSGMVPDRVIEQVMSRVRPENVEESCARLIELAKKGGGKDNVTIIIGYFLN